MSLFLGICALVGFCYVASFAFKALGKVACWIVGGVVAVAGALVLGSVAIVGVCFAMLLLCGALALAS